MQTVAQMKEFIDQADKAGLTDAEIRAIVDAVAADPKGGDIIQKSGGVRKRRFAGRGKGKSGGYRLLVAYLGEDRPVYLITLFGKGSASNLSDAGLKAIRALMRILKGDDDDETD